MKILIEDYDVRYSKDETYKLNVRKNKDCIRLHLEVIKDCSLDLCFNLNKNYFKQKVFLFIKINENVNCKLNFCCSFNSSGSEHISNKKIILEKNSFLELKEVNRGNKRSKLSTKSFVYLREGATLKNYFEIIESKISFSNVFVKYFLYDNSRLDQITKTYNLENNIIRIKEVCYLLGKESSAIIKTKGIVKDTSKTSLFLSAIGKGDYSKAHIDCSEILLDNGVAESIPSLKVKNETSRLSHEATIGSIEENKLEILMSKGLNREEAIKFLIHGFLR